MRKEKIIILVSFRNKSNGREFIVQKERERVI
jgi:hypothetical protein